jgi:ribosomal protein S1
MIKVVVLSATGNLVKCSTDLDQVVQSTAETVVNEHTMRPGYLVNAKIAKIFENGLKLTFLSGNQGTVFVDHIGKESLAKYKVGEKVQARCISHDAASKSSCMSLLPHIISMTSVELCEIGTTFEKARISKVLYGGSY